MDVREVLRSELKRQGRSAYWLARELDKRDVCTAAHVERYFAGKGDVTGKIIGAMLDLLGMKIQR